MTENLCDHRLLRACSDTLDEIDGASIDFRPRTLSAELSDELLVGSTQLGLRYRRTSDPQLETPLELSLPVYLVWRRGARLSRACEQVSRESGQQCIAVSGDAALSETARSAVDTAKTHFGRLDVLANIAGWYPTAHVEHTSDADFRATIDANLTATFVLSREALPMLRDALGMIVNMSSTAARFPTPGLAAYSAAKAGIEAFTRALAAEAAPCVRVNAVSAGPTNTEAVRELMSTDTTGAVRAVTANLPLGRLAEVNEIAEAILFLASRRSAVITGQVLHANCGGHMA